MRHLWQKLLTIVIVAGLLNFLLFVAESFYFGGDALNGRVEGQRYFLWGYHSGTKGYIEVSKAIFTFSKWHTYSTIVLWALMLLAGFAYTRIQNRADD
jgi:hypothetical protein